MIFSPLSIKGGTLIFIPQSSKAGRTLVQHWHTRIRGRILAYRGPPTHRDVFACNEAQTRSGMQTTGPDLNHLLLLVSFGPSCLNFRWPPATENSKISGRAELGADFLNFRCPLGSENSKNPCLAGAFAPIFSDF